MSKQACAPLKLIFLFLFAVLAFSPAVVSSQEIIVLRIIVNAVDLGDSFVVLTPEGDVWVEREVLTRARLRDGVGSTATFEEKRYVSLSSVPGLEFNLNEEEVSLEIEASAGLFEEQKIDVAHKRPYEIVYTRENSAFFNYSLNYHPDDSAADLSTELGARVGDWLGTSTFGYEINSERDRFVRLLTTLSMDDRPGLRRVSLGDFNSASGVLGTGTILGGINFSKDFSINPYFLQYPALSLSGALKTPSEVEVYVNGVLVRREKLLPGEFELSNVPASIGLGSSEIVIRDAYGAEEVVSESFFYTDRLLKRGLHEYSLSLGFLREDLGEESFSYGDPVVQAFHNVGLTRALKGGYSLEASPELVSAGPTASLRVMNIGVVDAALSVSGSRNRGGVGGFLGYFFRGHRVNVALSLRYLSRHYSNLAIDALEDKPRLQFTGSAGVNLPRVGSFSVDYSTTDYYTGEGSGGGGGGGDTDRYALLYTRNITTRANLFATASRTEVDNGEDTDEVFLGLHVYFGGDVSGSLGYTGGDDGEVKRASVQRSLPVGTGLGFRAQAEDLGDGTDLLADADYQTDYGTFGAGYRETGPDKDYFLSASGGVGYIDGSVFLSRPVTDSFAKVKAGEVEDVRVYYFGEEAGRTDSRGELIIPVLRSWRDNRVDIEKQDIPINYSIPSSTMYVNPPLRSGSLVEFDVTRVQGLSGHVYVVLEGEKVPVEFSRMLVILKERAVEGLVGRHGEFYVENVPEGTHPAKVFLKERACVFVITAPGGDEAWVDLGDMVCELGAEEVTGQ
ncbi:MAG TPA: fimbria/pilus outer membrane usher protein [Thermodesulfobacteriota bacterium]|nr:fimbria/pilus outer membrane usher protein [Thermodesulfobacteriota bacterium]